VLETDPYASGAPSLFGHPISGEVRADIRRQSPLGRQSSVVDSLVRNPYLWGMEVQFTPDQKAFVRDAIKSGRLQREEDAVKQGLLLWEERERRRIEILAAVDKAQASLERREGRRVTTPEEAQQLVEDIKRRGMARLAAERHTPRT
jgi:Arc/MetJ-type ribon-helix-helix transcriptional regulator